MSLAAQHIIDWDIIIKTIQDEKCILFVGPELYTNEKGETLEQQITDYLNVEKDSDICSYNDGLFFFRLRHKKTVAYYKLKEFFQRPFPETNDLFKKIASIPFHFIITVTPDREINDAFDELHLKYKSDFYWKKHQPRKDAPLPTQNIPLIYNILGSIQQQDSMILTHNDLFDYFESVFTGASMAEELRQEIKEANNFIFLGLHFEKWYMQMLLRILYLHTNEELLKYATNTNLKENIQTYFYDHFRINFINDNIKAFINKLYEECASKGILRQAKKMDIPELDNIRSLIAASEMDSAFDHFKHFLTSSNQHSFPLANDVTALNGRYNSLKKQSLLGVIDQEKSGIEMNLIRQGLLELVSAARKFE